MVSATRLENGDVRLVIGAWSDTFPEDRRASWASWYERMHGDYGKAKYGEAARALRDLPPPTRS